MQRTRAVRAARGSSAFRAHEHRGVAGPCHLHEHRPRGERRPCGGEGRGGDAGAARLPLAGGAQHDARAGATRRGHFAHPADLDEALDIRRAGVTGEDQGAAVELLPQQRGVPSVHAGAQGLGEQRIAVVPQGEQAEGVHRRVHRRAIADHDARSIGEAAQERRVPRRRALPGIDPQQGVGGHPAGQRCLELALVAMVGNDQDRAAARGERAHRGRGEQFRPRADDGAVGGAGQPWWRIHRHPTSIVDRVGEPGELAEHAVRLIERGRIDHGRLERSTGQPRLLGTDHPLGEGEAEDVGRRPGGAIGGATGQRVQRRRQDGLGRDDGIDLGERPVRGIRLPSFDDEPVDDAAGAAQRHAHAHARLRVGLEVFGDRVVEQPVELRQRRVEQHAGHRPRGHLRDRRPRAGRRRGRCAPR